MKYLLIFVLMVCGASRSQDIEEVSPQDIIDEVNNAIDMTNCGLDNLSGQIQESIDLVVDEINDTIRNILEQYDLDCLMGMLDVSFTGIFNINLSIPSFCEIALDVLDDHLNSSILNTPEGASLKSLLENNIKAKQEFKENVANEW